MALTETTPPVDEETALAIDVDTATAVDVEGGMDPEWEDGKSCTPWSSELTLISRL